MSAPLKAQLLQAIGSCIEEAERDGDGANAVEIVSGLAEALCLLIASRETFQRLSLLKVVVDKFKDELGDIDDEPTDRDRVTVGRVN